MPRPVTIAGRRFTLGRQYRPHLPGDYQRTLVHVVPPGRCGGHYDLVGGQVHYAVHSHIGLYRGVGSGEAWARWAGEIVGSHAKARAA